MRKPISLAFPDPDRQSFEQAEGFSRVALRWVMAPFLGLLALASIALVIAMAIEDPHYLIALSVPAGFTVMLWVTLRFSAARKLIDNVFPVPPPRTPWRLVDPRLSHWGVWRADIGRLPVEIGTFRYDHRQVKAYIRKLLDDWSFRSARGGGVVEISRPVAPILSPFGDGPKGWRVYRITLDDGTARRTGWLRLGAGRVEFQLQPNPDERRLLEPIEDGPILGRGERRLADVMQELLEEEQALRRDPFVDQHHPMWDRWIDP